jgi:subtilase family serine protease
MVSLRRHFVPNPVPSSETRFALRSKSPLFLHTRYDDPNIANDLHAFDQYFGLFDPPSFTKVNQTGGSTLPATNDDWATEIALDVEWSHAVAPGANILLVEANSNSYSDLMTAVNYASHQSGVIAVSMSWGRR